MTHDVAAFVAAALVRAGRDVAITAISAPNATAYGQSGSGGFVAVGNADATLDVTNTNRAFVGADGSFDGTGIYIQAGRLLSISATSSLNGSATSNADGGGFVADSDADSFFNLHGPTQAIIGEGGRHLLQLAERARPTTPTSTWTWTRTRGPAACSGTRPRPTRAPSIPTPRYSSGLGTT